MFLKHPGSRAASAPERRSGGTLRMTIGIAAAAI